MTTYSKKIAYDNSKFANANAGIYNNNNNTNKKSIELKLKPNSNSNPNSNKFYKNTTNYIKNNKPQIRFTKGMFRKKFYRDLIYLNLNKHCYIYIKHTINNTFITVKHRKRIILTKSSGSIGFKGPKRPGVYAAIELAKHVRNVIKKTKKTATIVVLSKISNNVKSIIKNLSYNRGIKILDIIQRIPVSHNGLRKSHVRRK